MDEAIRALIVILVMASGIFYLASRTLSGNVIAQEDFVRRRNTWIAITIVAFVSHNIWICLAGGGVVALIGSRNEKNRLALYFMLLFAVPTIPALIPGFGIMNYFMYLDIVTVIGLTLLVPEWLALRRTTTLPLGSTFTDKLVVVFLCLQFVLVIRVTTVTDAMRLGLIYPFFGAFLPYYVCSRALNSQSRFKDTLGTLCMACLLLAVVGMFEYSKHWMLYMVLSGALHGSEGWGWTYLARGESLRAAASLGQAIPLGYMMTIALAVWLFLRRYVPSQALWRVGFAVLCGGLLSTISRGPWAGAIAMFLAWSATGVEPVKNLTKALFAGAGIFGLLLVSPMGPKFIDLIPGVGNMEPQNTEYRQEFIAQSLLFIERHPWFGLSDFAYAPEFAKLTINVGVVDTLNIFLTVAISSGLVGLAIFLGIFLSALGIVLIRLRQVRSGNPEAAALGRALVGIWVGVVVIINTISGISLIPTMYWCMIGFCVGYANADFETPARPESLPADPRRKLLRQPSLKPRRLTKSIKTK
jgi:hypothetical protein